MGGPGKLRSPLADPVNLDVIGVVVATDRVVDRDDVGLLLAKDPSEPLGRLLDIGLPEAVRIVVGRRVLHPGVLVAEKLEPTDRELIGGRGQLTGPDVSEGLALGDHVGVSLAHRAVGCAHQHDAMPAPGTDHHRATGGDRLVVGVGVKEDRSRHLRDATGLAKRRDLLGGVPQIGK